MAERHTQPAEPAADAPTLVASADPNEVIPDALGNEPERVADADEQPAETGAGGLALPATGEVAGGNIKKVLEPPPSADLVQRPLVKEQAAMVTKVGQQIAGLIARPVTEWGVIGPGETIRGHMLLLDLNSGEKVRAMDGHRVNAGELYMNLRNVPEA